MLCPEIHGETGLDSLAGGSLLGEAHNRAVSYERAVPRMFEVISQQHTNRSSDLMNHLCYP